ncbi:hypothetical protein KR51_00017690 [Rubidibacter lacunae KORDI 51-2]|uniref:Methyl-accepting chemotaxis protein n=1 Tax=Rubidibacter lacunae KORDI 51-2 TaxID=582515 RepID=U5DIQ5_9CHRO|nr:hypothetical protein [Rubidibacter lacunae]ERN41551.1 hypothetical protein KR51_00017690 [Rubidibacter lacunae KORDI 51-2]
MFARNQRSSLNVDPNSTIADLPSHDCQVAADVFGEVVSTQFHERPDLPGVIVVDCDGSVVGVVSRRMFLEQMSQLYSLELYLRRPIRVLLEVLEADRLRLPSTTAVDRAVRQALARPPELLYEPLAVTYPDGSLRLLEMHLLLVAQSQIFAQINTTLNRQKEEARKYADGLKQEQAKVKEYTLKLQTEQLEVQRRNQMLELQGAKLSRQTHQITDLNERFVRVGEHLSSEGKQTFAEMMRSVDAICRSTNRILEIGRALSGELETVNGATQLIERVSQQVRHLSMQAALIVNRSQPDGSSSHLSGFNHITREIGSLGSQTFEASNQVNQIASRFRFQILELMNVARESESVAKSLVKRSQETQSALDELENIIGERRRPTTTAA